MAVKFKKYLVTGGAGFIGSYLIKYWLNRDPNVSIVNLDKLTYSGDLSRLKEIKGNPRYRFINGDICDAATVDRAMEGCQGVLHLAAETHVDRSLLDAKAFFDTNLFGTYVLLEAARKKGIGRFLYVSTDEVYGSRDKGFFKESDPANPSSPYSVAKTAGDHLALSYVGTHGLNVVVTRGSNTFGPFQYPEKVIPLFVSNALSGKKLPIYGDGLQIRNWIYVEDHCTGILAVFRKGRTGQAYNISSKNYLTNMQMTKTLLKELGKSETMIEHVKDRLGHDRRYALDASKLKELGWKEKFTFKDSFGSTLRWYRQNEAWWRAIKEKSQEFKKYYEKAYSGRAKA